jgi:carboxymethylenebutenolidase
MNTPARLPRYLPSLLALVVLGGCRGPQCGADPEEGPPAPLRVDMLGSVDEATFLALHELKTGAVEGLRGRSQAIDVPGHPTSACYLSTPEGEGPWPGVLVIHEWWGLNDHVRLWTDRLAAEGYAALAVDLYGGQVATSREQALSSMQAVDGERALATLRAARHWLECEPGGGTARTASIGWCFGGGWSLALALQDPELDAAVLYYGRTEVTPERAAALRAPVLGIFGDRDQGIPPEYVDQLERQLTDAGAQVRFLRFDADHAFANPSGARYDRVHAEAAWNEVRSFLGQHLQGP